MFIESDITYKWRNMNDNSESWHLMIAYMISISRSRQKYLQALNSATINTEQILDVGHYILFSLANAF